jgi:outer membrane receptor protein involved in Fe transport
MKFIISFCVMFILPLWMMAQQMILKGEIRSDVGVIPYASVSQKAGIGGTISSENGQFELLVEELPITLIFSSLGFESKEIEVENDDFIRIRLNPVVQVLNQVVVGASRYEEKILEAPVAIYKLSSEQLKSMGEINAYEAVKSMRGIQAQSSSLSLPSYNTRGFSDPGNFRFKQQLDGYDMTNPIGLAISNTLGVSDLDVSSVELVHGASSALYGSDAFNGVLRFYSKNPFDFPGFSFQTKSGVTVQEAAGTNPYFEQDFRLAHIFNEKWAFKMDLSYTHYYDWIGDDQSQRVTPGNYTRRDELSEVQKNDGYIAFDGVHSLGDEYSNGVGIVRGIDFLVGPDNDTLNLQAPLTRSGIAEKDLFTTADFSSNEMESVRGNFSFFFRPAKDWELEYTYKHSFSDWLIRSSAAFPQFNYLQNMHVLRVTHKGINLRGYRHNLDNFRGSWSATNAADAIQQALRSNENWASDFAAEYFRSGSLDQARNFADRFMPGGSEFNKEDFEAALAATSQNTDYSGLNSSLIPGSQAVDFSHYDNIDLDYDFEDLLPFKLQLGLNYRRYNIESDGAFYNDGPLGFGKPIIVNQYAAYAQASKEFNDGRLKLTGAIRADKQTDYNTNLSPRLTAVMKFGAMRNHIVRASYLTGFRNPSIQEGFFRLQLTSAFTIIGSAKRSLENFIYQGPSGNQYNMQDILNADGRGFESIQPEKNTSYELGYRTSLKNRWYIDASAYLTQYENFINRPNIFFTPENNPEDFQIFAIRQNRPESVNGYGAGLGIDYILNYHWSLGATYDWSGYDSPDFEASNPDIDDQLEKEAFLRSLQFNIPEHRTSFSLRAKNLGKSESWGIHYNFRYNGSYDYFSNFGETVIPAFNVSDVAISYKIKPWSSTIKIGGSNVFRQEYITIYGAPDIGSIYYVSFRYEQ